MPFWKVSRGSQPSLVDGSAARAPDPRLEPIQLFTTDGRLSGWIVALEERVTDVLNSREILRVCVDPITDTWADIEQEALLLVAPPPRGGANPRKIHRHKRRVRALVGRYTVEGVAHLPPGMPLDPYLLRTRQPFVALTDVILSDGDEREGGETHPVAIINVNNLEELHALLTIA
jgi:hypothetical protein